MKSAAGKSLFVESGPFAQSLHGRAGVQCADCHADLKGVKEFPHAEKLRPADCSGCHGREAERTAAGVHGPAPGRGPSAAACPDCHGTHDIRPRDDPESSIFPINVPETCERCHAVGKALRNGRDPVLDYNQSAHFLGLKKSGLSVSATCVSCHGGHDILRAADPASRSSRKSIVRTCGGCHGGIERDYLEGVHGREYLKGGPDVPVCTDCHDDHAVQSPQDVRSRVYATKVAAVCSRCHDNERLARQYGFLTSRLQSFSGSFHGTASRFGETRVANCASCHGFHDIRPSSDPRSSIHPANLASTCGRCHPGAGANVAKGKIHVVSARAERRTAHWVAVAYTVLIAGLIAVFLLFIASDLWHRIRTRWTGH